MFNLREYSIKKPGRGRLPDYLPWAALIAPGVILQKDGVFQKTLEFRGYDLDSSSEIMLVAGVGKLSDALTRLGSGWAIHCEAQRFKCEPIKRSTWTTQAGQLIDEERRANYDTKGQYESRYYLTFSYKTPNEKFSKLENFFLGREDEDLPARRVLAYFLEEVRAVGKVMEQEFVLVRDLDDAETLTYLHSTISTRRQKVAVPSCPFYLDALLPDQPLSVGDTIMLGDSYMPTCCFTGFPPATIPGILDKLNDLGIEYRWTTRFICMSKFDAEKALKKYRHHWMWQRQGLFTFLKEAVTGQPSEKIDEAAVANFYDAQSAIKEVKADEQAFGYFTGTVCVWHEDKIEAARRMKAVIDVIAGEQIVVKEEKFNNLYAWLGSHPGNNYANDRNQIIGTLTLAHLLPLSAIWAGEKENQHLKAVSGVGTPHMFCSTAKHTTFRMNLNVGDVGHTAIFGSTGAGKSTLTNMMALQFGRYPDYQVIIFDKDRSARCATLAVNGNYYEPGKDGRGLSFQPLAYVDSSEGLTECREFLLTLLEAQDMMITPEIRAHVEDGLRRFSSISAGEHRTLTEYCNTITDRTIKKAIQPYTTAGAYGHIFDGTEDGFRQGTWNMIEMGSLMAMGEAVITPALVYLFRRVEKMLDGRPTLVILDEAWLFLKHKRFADEIEKWLKTLRKRNAYVVFSTQEIHDAMKSSIMPAILGNCKTSIYLPDKKARTPAMREVYQHVGLTEEEINKLAKAMPKDEYFFKNERGGRIFSMDLGRVALALGAASSPKDHAFFDWMEANIHPDGYLAAMLENHDKKVEEHKAKLSEVMEEAR